MMRKQWLISQIIIITAVLAAFPLAEAVDASPLQDRIYDQYGVDLNGFIEGRQGWRLRDDLYEKDTSISEIRMQLDLSKDVDWGIIKLKGDMIGDQVEKKAYAELRELNLDFSPFDFMDAKIGRQTLTWGTGDLLFINDLFPKDWKSFFIGRDNEYLKAPSDAIKTSLFFELINIDMVYSPVFNASQYVDGTRISYWNPMLGRIAGRDFIFDDVERNSYFRDDEYAVRLSKNIGGIELGLYGYHGFWKTPEGLDAKKSKLFYPKLSVYGVSARGALWGGIGNLEAGFYDSNDDRDGDDPLIRNSEIRLLAGFERELAHDFTCGLQYYLEWMQKYDAYNNSIPDGTAAGDEYRHVLTLRLTRLFMNQNLRLSLFTYYSPSDQDGYFRPKVHYKVTDQWAIETGANIFFGKEDNTFFGQFKDNTNAFAGLRWSF